MLEGSQNATLIWLNESVGEFNGLWKKFPDLYIPKIEITPNEDDFP